MGITKEQLGALKNYQFSELFSAIEKLAIELAQSMTIVPAEISPDLHNRLNTQFSKAQITELVSLIAWENHRARMNRALDVGPMGFSGGAYCVLSEVSKNN